MSKNTSTWAALVTAAVVGCADSAPAFPEWADVQPILHANCIRCHGAIRRSGAPDGFRLDIYDHASATEFGRGAGTMATFIAARVADGTMPPRGFALADRQVETLQNWAASVSATAYPPLGEIPDNQPPNIALTRAISDSLAGGILTVEYEARDADFEPVIGSLAIGSQIDRSVHAGRGVATLDTTVIEPGTHALTATVIDRSGRPETIVLDTLEVTHTNTAPIAEVTTQFDRVGDDGMTETVVMAVDDALFPDAESPQPLTITIADPDPGDTHTLSVEAFRGDETMSIARDVDASVGDTPMSWDTTQVPHGSTWRLRVTVSDGTNTRTTQTGRFSVTHSQSTDRSDDVLPLIAPHCAACHPGSAQVTIPFLELGYTSSAELRLQRGVIYRRLIFDQTMPPRSTERLTGIAPLAEDDRRRIGEWLAAGAPQSEANR